MNAHSGSSAGQTWSTGGSSIGKKAAPPGFASHHASNELSAVLESEFADSMSPLPLTSQNSDGTSSNPQAAVTASWSNRDDCPKKDPADNGVNTSQESRRPRQRGKQRANKRKGGGRGGSSGVSSTGGPLTPQTSPLREHKSIQQLYSPRSIKDTSMASPSTLRSTQENARASYTSESLQQLSTVSDETAWGTNMTADLDKHSYHSRHTIDRSSQHLSPTRSSHQPPILPTQPVLIDDASFDDDEVDDLHDFAEEGDDDDAWEAKSFSAPSSSSPRTKKKEWLLRMNRKLQEIPIGQLDPSTVPLSAIMNAWAKTKSAQGASMVELWLKRAQQEYDSGNRQVIPTTKMYTMAVDAWARSGEGGAAAQHAEALLQRMHQLYKGGGHDALRPTTGIFNAVINAWARSKEKIAPARAEQILSWMQTLHACDIQPDKYTFNTVIHAYAKAGGTEAAAKAQELLTRMHAKFKEGATQAKPDTITYNVVINCWAKSGGKGASIEAEKLLARMHRLHEMGDPDVKPNVVTYGAVIDSFAKSGERGAAARADSLLANMMQLHQTDPVRHSDLLPNTYVFNTVINCWAKSKEHDAASKAEEMLVAMSRLHASGMPSLKPDAFTYTAVIDAWAKSGYRGAAARADQLLDKMEAKYIAGDKDLKPNTFTYNAVINALAKSGEAGAAARAERVLQNMVGRHRNSGGEDVKPTTINFNTVLDAWAKSGGGRAAAERAEEILEWMDRLHKQGNHDVRPDTITFNAVLDAWARSGDRMAPRRAEQILDHMDDLCRSGNKGVKPDTYTYNTLINAWAKSGERGSAARAEHVLSVMEHRHHDGDNDFKPNTRTHTSVIDAWAKSGEKGAARRAEQILNGMIERYEATADPDIKPNVHTANAVCNACAFSKHEEDRGEALEIAFRVFDWLSTRSEMDPDSYTYTILLSVCANLLPRDDPATRYAHARAFFESCRNTGYVNDYVLRKLRQTVSDDEYLGLVDYRTEPSASSMPSSWTRNAKFSTAGRGRKHNWNNKTNFNNNNSNNRRGK
jgi:hypothetical protein